MEAIMLALASQAGRALVQTMASEAWPLIRQGLIALYARIGESRANEVTNALEDSRRSVLNGGSTPEVVASRWQGRFEALLEVYPEQAEELREVIVRATSVVDAEAGRPFTVGGGVRLGNSQIIAHNSGGGTIWP
ncbi:hypothetical protein ACIA8B_30200 [Micromonospora chalcea]|uniref:hypothetical protein n=1 Tax=Micromonospora aurantiaca (nom. illeg.) TaxID=47850 RepID=UPI0036632CB2